MQPDTYWQPQAPVLWSSSSRSSPCSSSARGRCSRRRGTGWAALIPIYNVIVLLQITGKPIWWLVLYFIPLVNLVADILVSLELARRFGKGLGFGDAQYLGRGPVAASPAF